MRRGGHALHLGLGLLAVLSSGGCRTEPRGDTSPGRAPQTTAAAPGDRPARLVLGLTPYLPAEQMRTEYGPLAAHIATVTGIPTEVRVAKDYQDLTRLLRSYEVQLAAFSPLNYVLAKRELPGLVLLATHIADGSSTYSAYIIAREDSGIDSVEDLAGKRFAFVDRSSASGYLYPLAYLRSLGHEPERWFSKVSFAGNHPEAISQVLKGQVDAAATFQAAYRLSGSKQLRIIATTGRIPYDAYTASDRLDGGLAAQIRQLLLDLSTRTDAGRAILGGPAHINGFVQVGDEHYAEVRRVAQLVEATSLDSPAADH